MNKFYFTLAENQGGPGCIEVEAEDYDTAREIMFDSYGPRWAFQYSNITDVHPADRTILGVL